MGNMVNFFSHITVCEAMKTKEMAAEIARIVGNNEKLLAESGIDVKKAQLERKQQMEFEECDSDEEEAVETSESDYSDDDAAMN